MSPTTISTAGVSIFLLTNTGCAISDSQGNASNYFSSLLSHKQYTIQMLVILRNAIQVLEKSAFNMSPAGAREKGRCEMPVWMHGPAGVGKSTIVVQKASRILDS